LKAKINKYAVSDQKLEVGMALLNIFHVTRNCHYHSYNHTTPASSTSEF